MNAGNPSIGVTMQNLMDYAPIFGVLMTAVVLLVLVWASGVIRYIANNRVAVVEKLWSLKGSVSELEWQLFLRDEVTRRFPDGLTVWDAQGQWRAPAGRIDHEQSKVLLIVHPDTPAARQSILDIIASYRKAFEQDSVLWESARVCIAG